MAEPHVGRRRPPRLEPAPDVLERLRKQESLQLSRVRILNEIEAAQNPRYRELLSKTLADLDSRIAHE